jgi:short chain dehydrogenase
VSADLRSQPQPEPAAVEDLQIVSGMRQMQWTARSGNRDIGHQGEVGLPRRDGKREERIVLAFEGEESVGNVIAPLHLARAVIPGMRDVGAGWIVNLTSAGANLHYGPSFYLGPQGSTMEVYGTTKAALSPITSGLAGDLYATGIRVNAVGPRVAVMSEGFGDLLGPDAIESIEEIVEAVVAFCDCPEDVTGKIAVSLDVIADRGLTVHGLDGLARV